MNKKDYKDQVEPTLNYDTIIYPCRKSAQKETPTLKKGFDANLWHGQKSHVQSPSDKKYENFCIKENAALS